MQLPETEALRRAREADHGVLSTVHPSRGVDAVPACSAIHRDVIAIPIDRIKPKTSTKLQRIRNLAVDPWATLLCEYWDPVDWSQLWWVRLALLRSDETAEVRARLESDLRAKYEQCRSEPSESILTSPDPGCVGLVIKLVSEVRDGGRSLGGTLSLAWRHDQTPTDRRARGRHVEHCRLPVQ